jgi:hypothetical protein
MKLTTRQMILFGGVSVILAAIGIALIVTALQQGDSTNETNSISQLTPQPTLRKSTASPRPTVNPTKTPLPSNGAIWYEKCQHDTAGMTTAQYLAYLHTPSVAQISNWSVTVNDVQELRTGEYDVYFTVDPIPRMNLYGVFSSSDSRLLNVNKGQKIQIISGTLGVGSDCSIPSLEDNPNFIIVQ